LFYFVCQALLHAFNAREKRYNEIINEKIL
jgi:hypothetical protein